MLELTTTSGSAALGFTARLQAGLETALNGWKWWWFVRVFLFCCGVGSNFVFGKGDCLLKVKNQGEPTRKAAWLSAYFTREQQLSNLQPKLPRPSPKRPLNNMPAERASPVKAHWSILASGTQHYFQAVFRHARLC